MRRMRSWRSLNSVENASPNGAHWFGTDANGFDMLGRIMYGGKASLEVGFAACRNRYGGRGSCGVRSRDSSAGRSTR